MVYCGKPSRGCQMCRTRRIKCDETKPTCNQCAKSRRQCPGYKDEFDLIFRNETAATARRAQRSQNKRAAAAAAAATTKTKTGRFGEEPISPASTSSGQMSPVQASSFSNDSPTSPLELAIIPALQVPVQAQATCHFVSNFVLVPRQGSTRGFMDFLLPLLRSVPANSHLQHAFNACAYASSGNRIARHCEDYSRRATDEYTKALSATGIALRDPVQAKSDAALAAVLLLGLFENITATQLGDHAWNLHIEGAIQIVKSRGRRQLTTRTGLLLFIAVRTQLIVYSLTANKHPSMGPEWWLEDAVNDPTAAECQYLALKTSEIRAEATSVIDGLSRTPENARFIRDLMGRSQALEEEMVYWIKRVPAHWTFKALCWEDHVPGGDYAKAEVYPGRVDIYQDFWIASVWNMLRVSRLVLQSVMVRCAAWICSPMDYRTTPEYAKAAQVCSETITDVLASVPYHLGWHTKRKSLFNRPDLSGFACGDDEGMKGLAAYFLAWPLACVMSQDYAADTQRRWVVGRLRRIGDQMGIRYAHILSQMEMRFPSMLIARDRLSTPPSYPTIPRDSAACAAPSLTPYAMSLLQQWETKQKQASDKKRVELLVKASGTAGQSGLGIASRLLTVTY